MIFLLTVFHEVTHLISILFSVNLNLTRKDAVTGCSGSGSTQIGTMLPQNLVSLIVVIPVLLV